MTGPASAPTGPDREDAMTPARPPADTDAPAVEVQDLSVVLGSSLILSGIDLRIEPGESVALLGANGSGKSTLVRTVLGLLPIRTGTVRLFGHNVARRSSVPWRRVGYVPQRVGAAAGVPATALEVVRSGLLDPRRPLADRGRRARERALKALEAVGLAERADEGWYAELNGEPLEPTGVQGPTGTWRQAFSVPRGGGELVVAHRSTAGTTATRLIWAVWAVTVLAALPLRRKGTIA